MSVNYSVRSFSEPPVPNSSSRGTRSWLYGILFFGVFTLVAAPCFSTAAAQSGDPQSLFEQSLILYRNGDYEQSRTVLTNLANRGSRHPHLTKTYLLLSAVYEKLGDLTQAQHYARQLLRQYPTSRFAGEALFALARYYYAEEKYVESLSYLLTLIDRNPTSRLADLSLEIGTKMVADGLYEEGLASLVAERTSPSGKNILFFWLARQSYGLGRAAEGDVWLQKIQTTTSSHAKLQELVRALKTKPANAWLYPVRIGIILPLSGEEADNGTDFLRGLALALDDQPQKIKLIIRDSGSSIKRSIRMMRELLDSHVSLIIGELEGDRTSALAALAAERNVLYLAPVASDNGISDLGARVFQMSSDLETRGAAIARYVYKTMGLRTFATLAPADEYGQAMTDAFSNAVDRLGGTMVAQQWYYPGTQDVSRQFASIRESALHFSPRDSLTLAVYQDSLAVAAREIQPDYDYSHNTYRTMVQDREVAIKSIDGFFMPIYAEDISLLGPQFALANIQAMPLGGDDWLHNEALRNQRRYLDGAIFCAGTYAPETKIDYIQFRNSFRERTAASPGPLALSGYDIMQLILQAIRAGNRSDSEIASYLSQLKQFSALGTTFSFVNHHRVNAGVVLLQYKDGIVVPLEH